MNNEIINVVNEISKLEYFTLKLYFDYIDRYGKKFMLKVYKELLKKSNNNDLVINKYIDAFLSIEFENIEINDTSVNALITKYGEANINQYIFSILDCNYKSLEFKKIYKNVN